MSRMCLNAYTQLRADCRTDPRLLAAYAALDPGGMAAAVALRCEELLAGMAPVLQVPAHETCGPKPSPPQLSEPPLPRSRKWACREQLITDGSGGWAT
jgi:hypothetical protein